MKIDGRVLRSEEQRCLINDKNATVLFIGDNIQMTENIIVIAQCCREDSSIVKAVGFP